MPKNPLGTYLTLDMSMPRLRQRRPVCWRVKVSRSRARSAPSQISTGPRSRMVTPFSLRIFIRSLREAMRCSSSLSLTADICEGLRSASATVGCDGQLETQSTDQFRAVKEPPAAANCLTQAGTRANNRILPARPDTGGCRSMLPFCNTPPGFSRFGNSRNKQTPGPPDQPPPYRPRGRGPIFLIHPSVQLANFAQSLNSGGIFLVFLRRKKRGDTTEKAKCTEAPLDSLRIMAQRSVAHWGYSKERPRVPHAVGKSNPAQADGKAIAPEPTALIGSPRKK